MDRQQNITDLSDIFEPDMYNGRLHHLPSINVMLASHLGAAGSDNVSVPTAYALSRRRNSDSTVSSSADASHADIDDFEIVDYNTVYAQSQEELVHRNGGSQDFSPSFTPTGAPFKVTRHRRRRSSFSKLRSVVGGLLHSRQRA
ncbi:hypothetical protein IWW57_001239 [Coemansia sp. S610]|nr:hypothetical protein IWW57_001239 [Coemansia sp. S610]